MARLIAIKKPGSGELGFIVSGVPMPDGSVKSYFAFNNAKILALNEIFKEIMREKMRVNDKESKDGYSGSDHGRIGRRQVNIHA